MLQGMYNAFAFAVRSGEMCQGEMCQGWFASDLDTWHQCPCGRNGHVHPEDDTAGEPCSACSAGPSECATCFWQPLPLSPRSTAWDRANVLSEYLSDNHPIKGWFDIPF